MKVVKEEFGISKNGERVEKYSLINKMGAKVSVLNYGLIVQRLEVLDKDGELRNIVLGFDHISDYEDASSYYGAVIGRYAGRIAKGSFTIAGETYNITADGSTALHGGELGFDKRMFHIESSENADEAVLECSYISPDMEEGFPGTLEVKVFISFNEKNELKFRYLAKTDKDTIVSLTNHSYFNITGDYSKIYDEELFVNADEVMYFDEQQVPAGFEPVFDALDFRAPIRIGDKIFNKSLDSTRGIDHVFKLAKDRGVEAVLKDAKTGIKLEVETSEKALVVYCQNFLDELDYVYDGIKIENHSAVCLETQYFPNSINIKGCEKILRKDDIYDESTTFRFGLV